MSKIISPEYYKAIQRKQVPLLLKRWAEKRSFIQILHGPRQVGKTTAVTQALAASGKSFHIETADDKQLVGTVWIEQQWNGARAANKDILVLDEIQKISGWSETIKRLWDEDTKNKSPMHVTLLGSSALLMHQGMTESLAGRFELIPISHWSFQEMQEAFSITLEEYIFFGGYPSTVALFSDLDRWQRMILDSLIETTVSRDILLHSKIEKPALLKRLFELVCTFSSQILSYQKMVGQLQDVGNTTTLAHYLNLLSGAGLCTALQKYEEKKFKLRSSIPKLQVLNTALISAYQSHTLESAQEDTEYWGRLTESAIGAFLLNWARENGAEVFYWREGNNEVDFILQKSGKTAAFEVKSGRIQKAAKGMDAFQKKFKKIKAYLIGSGGIPLQEFFESDLQNYL